MSKKIKADDNGFIYSTNPDFVFENQDAATETLLPAQQKLRIRMETKHRAGKVVSLIAGFIGTEADLETLGKQLKNHCGTGGSAKDGEIIIQGDHRPKILAWLIKNGYTQSR